MGALSHGHEAARVLEKLPDDLDVPITRVLLKCYEEGGGLEGAMMCVPKELLLKLETFLKDLMVQQEAAWKAFETAGGRVVGWIEPVKLPDGTTMDVPEDEIELIHDFVELIDKELYTTPDGDPTKKVARDRVIDGGKLYL